MLKNLLMISFIMCCSLISGHTLASDLANKQPNVIIVMTDDQGYGDFGFTGNPIVKTPSIDAFAQQNILLNNFHVDPTCSPTRSALMTGRYSGRVGVWHTIMGRSMLRKRETTMAQVFAHNGYNTGIFGKWHLGDAYPYRPEDRGFSHIVMHGGGGIPQTPDFWGNDYFDDTFYNYDKQTQPQGIYKKHKGFVTDVFFNESMDFMRASKAKGKPFFTYISTNAPHNPKRAPEKYANQYAKLDKARKHFFGMITNIDDNFARLQHFLKDEGLEQNTILIFTTDNGSAGGVRTHSAGLKGGKGSHTDGGHRVPFIVKWPAGKLNQQAEVDQLTAHIDILPTFIDLLKLKTPDNMLPFDGTSLSKAIYGDKDVLRNRTLMVENQRVLNPKKWRNTAVMTDQWRLLDENKLYNIKTDRKQNKNVASQYPEVVATLQKQYDNIWNSIAKDHHISSAMILGNSKQNPVRLTGQDFMGQANWSQEGIVWKKNKNEYWRVEVEQAGNYEVSIRRWPAEFDQGINQSHLNSPVLNTKKAYFVLEVDNKTNKQQKIELETPVLANAKQAIFKLKLTPGIYKFYTGFYDAKNKKSAANYAYILNSDIYQKDKSTWFTREGLGLPKAEASTDYPLTKPVKKNKKKKK